MKRLLLILTALLLVTLLVFPVACASKEEAPTPSIVPAPAPAPMPPTRTEGFVGKAGGALPAAEDRMIIHTGDISLVVEDVVNAQDEIAQLAKNLGGYVVSSYLSGREEDRRGNISIRVPDEKLELALAALRSLAVRVTSEHISSQDITEEYIDLDARLKNAQATEAQYLALLDKAQDVEDIMKIYESLSRVRGEIEQIKGRMQYLERASDMSLLSVSLEAESSAKPLVRAGWSILEVLKSAVRGITTFGQVLVNIVIWVVIFIPVWGTIAGLVYWFLRRRRKRRAAS